MTPAPGIAIVRGVRAGVNRVLVLEESVLVVGA
jgi:hypothetical protein